MAKKEKKDEGVEVLRKELFELIGRIDDEDGLRTLIRQSAVIIHNREIDRLNKTLKKTGASGPSPRKTVNQKPDPGAVDIEEKDGSFIIVVNQQRVFFNRQEMRQIAKLCWAADDPKDGAGRLYRWFKRERNDMLQDGMIGSAGHPALTALYTIIRSRYKVKD
ncbi:MAG: hypothetical protein ACLFSE_01275 [Spirochaetia bacterium]